MYSIKDYLNRGIKFANNLVFSRHKKLSTLMIYSTSLCDSHCKHCYVWAQRPVKHISKEKIIEIMQSRCVSKKTSIGLEGGEFLLHPEAQEILKWFSENHKNFDLLSNCLKPENVIESVRKYPPKRLYLSLDGGEETYRNMRGVDGYNKVIRVIEECREHVPISLMFTLSPFNTFADLEFVVNIAKKYNIDIRIGIYNNIDFFDTQTVAHEQNSSDEDKNFSKNIPSNVKETSENYDFLCLYDEWKNGNLKMNCYSILDSLVIHPDGNVPICQNLDKSLGNIYENSLDEIFNGKKNVKIQKEYAKNCNKCWINFHRKYDIVLLRNLERFLPKKLIELFYGKYRWTCDEKVKYKGFMKIIN